jgi:hypothetical protein
MYDVDGLGINLVVVHILRLRDVIHSRHTAGDSDILTAVLDVMFFQIPQGKR